MQKWLWLALQSGLEISLAVVVGQSIFAKLNLRSQRRYSLAALALAVLASLITSAFWLTNLAAKQSFAAQTGVVVTIASLSLLLFLWLPVQIASGRRAGFFGWLTLLMVAFLTWVLFLDVVPFFENILTANTAFMTTDMLVRLSLGVTAIFLILILTLALSMLVFAPSTWTPTNKLANPSNQLQDEAQSSTELGTVSSSLLFKIASSVGLLVICLTGLTTALQMLLVLGQLPATPFLFNLVSILVNQSGNWFYPLFASLVFIALLGLLKKARSVQTRNKAEARKIKASQRHQQRWAAVALSTCILIISFAFVTQTVAGREGQLSPAKEVKVKNGFVEINAKEVKDKNLHRFSVTIGGRKARFLVVYKGAGLFGTAFDACELCGQAGYYQQGSDIICKNCNSVVNKATVGFPGGCNPIPLASKMKNGKLLIKIKDIEAKAGVFK